MTSTKVRVEVTDVENEADERADEVCSRDKVKHSEINCFF